MLRVAVIGPESCGKTSLVRVLQQRLRDAGVTVAVVDEYARAYYAARAYCPEPADVLAIARGQLEAQRSALQRRPAAEVLLCDSTVLTCKIWAEVSFGLAEQALARLNRPQDYDLTLLACPDIPWSPDPLRSHENGREALLERYRQALRDAAVAWVEIRGEGAERCDLAWQALQLKKPELIK